MLKTLAIFAVLLASSALGGIGLMDGNYTDHDEHMSWMMGPWFGGMPILMWFYIIFGFIILVLFIILLVKLIEKL